MTDLTALNAAAKLACTINGAYDTGAVANRISSIRTRGAKLDADIHAVAVACLHFAMPKGMGDVGDSNAEPARQLLSAMPKGSRAKTLGDWFEAYSNVRLKMGKDGKWSVGIAKADKAHPADKLEELAKAGEAKPFWSVEEKTAGAQAFDLNAALIKLFAQADKAIEKGQIDDTMLDNVVKLRDFAKATGLPTEKAAPVKIAA